MPGLQDRTIAITRSEQDAREFFQLVSEEGGRALAIPAIEIVPAGPEVAKGLLDLLEHKRHDYCAFMSAQAVRVLFGLVDAKKLASRLKDTKIIAVGPKTSQELEGRGLRVDLVPEKYSSIGLVELLSKGSKGKKIIIPRSGEANDFAAKALSELGMKVDEVFLYKTRTAGAGREWREFDDLLAQKKIDAIVFTSASNVRGFFEIMRKELPKGVRAISIGPFTTAELAKMGVKCHEATDHTIKGTVEAAKKLLRNQV